MNKLLLMFALCIATVCTQSYSMDTNRYTDNHPALFPDDSNEDSVLNQYWKENSEKMGKIQHQSFNSRNPELIQEVILDTIFKDTKGNTFKMVCNDYYTHAAFPSLTRRLVRWQCVNDTNQQPQGILLPCTESPPVNLEEAPTILNEHSATPILYLTIGTTLIISCYFLKRYYSTSQKENEHPVEEPPLELN